MEPINTMKKENKMVKMNYKILTFYKSINIFHNYLNEKFDADFNPESDYLCFLEHLEDYYVNSYIIANDFVNISHIFAYFKWLNKFRKLNLNEDELIKIFHEWITN